MKPPYAQLSQPDPEDRVILPQKSVYPDDPGAALNAEYEAFTDTDRRDDWYIALPPAAKWALIDYRAHLRRKAGTR